MKKYHLNLLYTREDDIEVVGKFMKLIESIEGISIETFSIETLSEEEFQHTRIKF